MARYRRIVRSVALCGVVVSVSVAVPPTDNPPESLVYKQTFDSKGNPVSLTLHLFKPVGWQAGDARPCVVFFFGGGWVGGSPSQFYPHCEWLAAQGLVAASADYRVSSRHGTTPFDCVEDGKSAVRYARAHARELGIDPDRIVAGGGSAGGHVGACTGVIDGYDGGNEDTAVSSRPNAMVLFNPVIDTSPEGYGHSRLKQRFSEISPNAHVKAGVPPTLVFHGTADKTVPYENLTRFKALMDQAGNRCDLVPFDERGHGFFNAGRAWKGRKDADYLETLQHMKTFLESLKYLGTGESR